MVELTSWIDRRFEFNFAVGVFPCILERLRGTPARIVELVRNIPEAGLTKRTDGKWSIQENIGHLIKVEELHDGRIDDYLANNEILRPADMKNRRTFDADYNSQDIDKVIESFRTVRMNFLGRLEEQDEEIVSRSAHHARLNITMRLVDMAAFAAEHDDYHLAVITELAQNYTS
jgi:uncharacterized damage-inducible protein DinB